MIFVLLEQNKRKPGYTQCSRDEILGFNLSLWYLRPYVGIHFKFQIQE
jgi:hypothetical protein